MKPRILIQSTKQHYDPNPESGTFGMLAPNVFETDQTCDTCGKTYMALTLNGRLWTTGNCIPCSERVTEQMNDQESKGSKERMRGNFLKLCPQMYQDFKRDLLPRADLYDDVISWQIGKKGLLLIGDSRMGKTRCAWQLMRRIYCMEGILFEAITELQFSHKVSEFGRSDTLKDWIDRLCRIKVLFIDDLGKAVMTERTSSELFYVFEERMKNHRAIIATMQIDPINYATKISNRSGKEMADSILNRLKENCEIIQF